MPTSEPALADPGKARGRILIVSELGGNLGHVLRMRQLAEHLEHVGLEVEAALPRVMDQQLQRVHMGGRVCWECPRIPERDVRHRALSSYGEMLERHVLPTDGEVSNDHYAAWMVLFESAKPDLLLAEFAPSAMLASRLFGMPVVHAGTGWEVPKVAATNASGLPRLPMLRSDDPSNAEPLRAQASRLENLLTIRANALLRSHGRDELRHVSEIFTEVEDSLLMTIPELDHFGERLGSRYIGPAFSTVDGAECAWPLPEPSSSSLHRHAMAHRPRVLAYLHPHPVNIQVLRALDELHANVVASLPGVLPSAIHRLGGGQRKLHDGPVRLDGLLPVADLVISNGGHGLMAASLMNGVPVLALPRYQEQECLGRQAQLTGAVACSSLGSSRPGLKNDIASLLQGSAARDAARALARRYKEFTTDTPLNRVVSAVVRACGKNSRASSCEP